MYWSRSKLLGMDRFKLGGAGASFSSCTNASASDTSPCLVVTRWEGAEPPRISAVLVLEMESTELMTSPENTRYA